MPIEYNGKKYRFQSLVNKIKNTKPEISNPNGYVAAIEKRQNKSAQLKAKLVKLAKDIDKSKKIFKKTQYIKETGEHYDDENERRKSIQDKLNQIKGAAGYPITDKALNTPSFKSKKDLQGFLGTPGHDNATRGATDAEHADLEKAKRDKQFQQTKVNVKTPGASY